MQSIKLVSGAFEAIVTFDEVSTQNVNIGSEKEPKNVPANIVVVDCGATYIGQRDGWTAFYKPLIGESGEKRNTVEFSDDLASRAAASLTETLSPYLTNVSVTVTEHERAEGVSEMKRATALVDSFLGVDGMQEAETAYRTILGSPNGDRDELIRLAHERKLGITPPREKKAKS